MIVNQKTLLLVAGWTLAGLASTALIAQHLKWSKQQDLWEAELVHNRERVIELETIIAELHTDMDERGPGINEAASKTGSAISNVFERVKKTFSNGTPPQE